MTENTAKVLKEGFNQVTVVGTLVEKNLEDTFYTKQDGTRVDQLKGSISIRTGEHEVHQIRLQTNKFTNAGAENSFYKGYKTIQDEYVSVADLANNPDLVPTQLRVNGKLTTNEYYGQDGKLRQYQQIEGTFVNRLTEKDDPTPRAKFETEIFISNTRAETNKDGDESGRALVESWIPTYSGIVPYKFAVVEQGADFFVNDIEKGQTIKVFGRVLNKREEHIKLVEAAFGDPIEEKSYTYTTESLIDEAIQPYDEDNIKAFNPELVNERLVKRNIYLDTQKAKGQQGASSEKKAFGTSAPVTNNKVSDIVGDVSKLF